MERLENLAVRIPAGFTQYERGGPYFRLLGPLDMHQVAAVASSWRSASRKTHECVRHCIRRHAGDACGWNIGHQPEPPAARGATHAVRCDRDAHDRIFLQPHASVIGSKRMCTSVVTSGESFLPNAR
jgi:hypothetical protein